jgi:hypothetical protein
MSRALTRLPLFTLVLCACLALSAGAAQAVQFHAETAEGKLTGAYPKGEQGGEGEAFNFITPNGIAPCLRVNLSGSLPEKTTSSITLHAEFSECFFTTKMNGCVFVLSASGTLAIAGEECATKPIEIVRGACIIRYGPQEGLSSISYENAGTGSERHVTATFKITKLHYTQTGSFCANGNGTFTDGEMTAKATIKADNAEGKQQGFWVE